MKQTSDGRLAGQAVASPRGPGQGSAVVPIGWVSSLSQPRFVGVLLPARLLRKTHLTGTHAHGSHSVRVGPSSGPPQIVSSQSSYRGNITHESLAARAYFAPSPMPGGLVPLYWSIIPSCYSGRFRRRLRRMLALAISHSRSPLSIMKQQWEAARERQKRFGPKIVALRLRSEAT